MLNRISGVTVPCKYLCSPDHFKIIASPIPKICIKTASSYITRQPSLTPMARGSKSQYRARPSPKSHWNGKNRRSTGRPYEKIPRKDSTPTAVEDKELSPSTDNPETEEAPLDVSQLTF